MAISADEFTDHLHTLTGNALRWTDLVKLIDEDESEDAPTLAQRIRGDRQWAEAGHAAIGWLDHLATNHPGPQPGAGPERLKFLVRLATENQLGAKARSEIDGYKGQIADLSAELAKVRTTLESYRREFQEVADARDAAEERVRKLTTDPCSTCRQEKYAAQERARQLEVELAQDRARMADLEARLAARDAEIAKLKADALGLEADVEEALALVDFPETREDEDKGRVVGFMRTAIINWHQQDTLRRDAQQQLEKDRQDYTRRIHELEAELVEARTWRQLDKATRRSAQTIEVGPGPVTINVSGAGATATIVTSAQAGKSDAIPPRGAADEDAQIADRERRDSDRLFAEHESRARARLENAVRSFLGLPDADDETLIRVLEVTKPRGDSEFLLAIVKARGYSGVPPIQEIIDEVALDAENARMYERLGALAPYYTIELGWSLEQTVKHLLAENKRLDEKARAAADDRLGVLDSVCDELVPLFPNEGRRALVLAKAAAGELDARRRASSAEPDALAELAVKTHGLLQPLFPPGNLLQVAGCAEVEIKDLRAKLEAERERRLGLCRALSSHIYRLQGSGNAASDERIAAIDKLAGEPSLAPALHKLTWLAAGGAKPTSGGTAPRDPREPF